MTKLLDLQTSELLNKFGAGNAVPGSGSAAALIGLLAAQLLNTVIELTQKRKSSVEHLPSFIEIDFALRKRIIPNLACLLQSDSDQFEKVIQHRIQRDTTSDAAVKRAESVEAQKALVPATELLLQIAEDCVEITRFAFEAFDHGFKAARGDSGVAMTAATSTITGCLFIIELNLGQFNQNHWTRKIRKARLTLCNTLEELHQEAQRRLSEQISITERKAEFRENLAMIRMSLRGRKFSSNKTIEKLATRLQRLLWINQDLIKGNPIEGNPFKILDPEVALKCLGFKVERQLELGQIVLRGREYKVAGQIDQRSKTVSISRLFPHDIQKFTSAHELGHALLHTQEVLHRDRPIDGSEGPRDASSEERQADKFASYFLMPEKLLRETFGQLFGVRQFKVDQDTVFKTKNTFVSNQSQTRSPLARCRNLRDLSCLLADTTFYDSRSFASLSQRFGVSTQAMAIRLEELDLVIFPSVAERAELFG